MSFTGTASHKYLGQGLSQLPAEAEEAGMHGTHEHLELTLGWGKDSL